MKLEGIHHISAITGDARANVEFYTGLLGLRMVKRTVNQDEPQMYHLFYGDSFTMEFPTGSGRRMNLDQIARELARRLIALYLPDANGKRPAMAANPSFANDTHWRKLVWFHEYFNGDSGAGLGANHQTGWTALVARLIEEFAE